MALKYSQIPKDQKLRPSKRRFRIPPASIGIFYIQITSSEDAKHLADAIRDERVILCDLTKMQRWEEADAILFIKRMQSISSEYGYSIVRLQENTLILYPPTHYLIS